MMCIAIRDFSERSSAHGLAKHKIIPVLWVRVFGVKVFQDFEKSFGIDSIEVYNIYWTPIFADQVFLSMKFRTNSFPLRVWGVTMLGQLLENLTTSSFVSVVQTKNYWVERLCRDTLSDFYKRVGLFLFGLPPAPPPFPLFYSFFWHANNTRTMWNRWSFPKNWGK